MINQPRNEVVLHTCGHVCLYELPPSSAEVLNGRLQALKHMPCMHCQARGCHTPATSAATPATRRRHARARAHAHSPCTLTWAQALAAAQDAAVLALLCLLALVCAAMLALLEGALG